MLTQSVRRPLGAWKGVMRCARQQPRTPLLRTMATETTPTSPSSTSAPPPPKPTLPTPSLYRLKPKTPNAPPRSVFAVYPQARSAKDMTPEPLKSYHAQQIGYLDPTGARTALFSRRNRDGAKPGDVLMVTTKKGEPFSGVCLSIRRRGVDTAVLLRNHLTRVGVEMWFKVYSPNVVGIQIVSRRPRRARRARLFYMRQPKHDMGNVDHLVAAWRRTRNIFKSRAGKAAEAKAAAAAAAAAKAKGKGKGKEAKP
ncbi:translation protein SH3-like domain-containing protein [Xylariaceae sp. FL0594]|nr:translation protein SH3-like domain-containing protein [Xylariaceae sp. FL0594]